MATARFSGHENRIATQGLLSAVINQRGLHDAMKAIPDSAAFHVHLASARALRRHKKRLVASMRSEGKMARFVERGLFFRQNPGKLTQSVVRSFAKQGHINKMFVSSGFGLPAAKLHETGGTVRYGKAVPILSKKGETLARNQRVGKRSPGGQLIRKIIQAKGKIDNKRAVFIKASSGVTSVFLVDRKKRKKRRSIGSDDRTSFRGVNRIATFVRSTTFRPKLGFDRMWSIVQRADLPGLLDIAVGRIRKDWLKSKGV